jgi:type II secretory pathway pseudopilin PulG
LLEAVVTACLLGIFAAFAIPRFTHLSNSARASEVVALSTQLRKAAEVAHLQYLISGAKLPVATLEGRSVALKNGYPDASGAGIRSAVFDAGGFTAHDRDSFVIFIKSDAPSGERCSVRYNTASETTGPATVTNLDTSGC